MLERESCVQLEEKQFIVLWLIARALTLYHCSSKAGSNKNKHRDDILVESFFFQFYVIFAEHG